MKKAIRLFAVCLSVLLLFVSCSSGHKVTFDSENDTCYDKSTGVTYSPLSASFEPIARGEEYGTVNIAGVKYTLYAITGQDPEKFLCTEYGDVYCRQDVAVPALTAWENVEGVRISLAGLANAPAMTISAEVADEASLIEELTLAYREGQAVRHPVEEPVAAYILRFTSPDAPGLYYTLRYYEYGEDIFDTVTDADGTTRDVNFGRYFLYDRYEGRCVAVADSLHRLIEGDVS